MIDEEMSGSVAETDQDPGLKNVQIIQVAEAQAEWEE
jgi:hypothetical protein